MSLTSPGLLVATPGMPPAIAIESSPAMPTKQPPIVDDARHLSGDCLELATPLSTSIS